jgi:AAA domain-containing protein
VSTFGREADALAARTREHRKREQMRRLVVRCAADIEPKKVDWLWEQRLPLGKCSLVAGEGGLGKSMVLAWIAATVSRGGDWPCGEGQSPCGSVIVLSAEDDAADTIVPRLIAAHADCSKVHIVSAVHQEDDKGHRTFNLQLDLPNLKRKSLAWAMCFSSSSTRLPPIWARWIVTRMQNCGRC